MIAKPKANTVMILIGFLFIIVFYQSVNKYKIDAETLPSYLTEIKISSYSLTESIQTLITGRRIDYDSLNRSKNRFQNSISELVLNRSETSKPLTLNLNYNNGISIGQKKATFSTDKLESALKERSLIIEDFKSVFSTIRNSEIIIFELLDSLRKDQQHNSKILKKINQLETIVLKEKQFNYKKNYSKTLNKIKEFNANVDSPNHKIPTNLNYIKNHIASIVKNGPLIEEIINQELDISNLIKDEINAIEKKAKNSFEKENRRSFIFSVILIILSLSILIIAARQMRHIHILNKRINKHNETLEDTVNRRTKTIRDEKKHSESILKSLKKMQEKTTTLINNIEGCVYEYDLALEKISYISPGVEKIWGMSIEETLTENKIRDSIYPEDRDDYYQNLEKAINSNSTVNLEYRIHNNKGEPIWVREITTPITSDEGSKKLAGIYYNITSFKNADQEREKMQKELVQSQKLELVGQLAAGIAHEINTPAQFISDNLMFLQESVDEVLGLFKNINKRIIKEEDNLLTTDLKSLMDDIDMPYLEEEIPSALHQSYEGITSVAKIIRAMKNYSHPGESFELVDINASMESTITICSSEWKYFSKMEKNFDENLPMVECVAGDINQVVLNIIVNAAHAIVEKYSDPDNLEGKIIVQTKHINDSVIIEIIDNGNGMPENVKDRIFDQFFTTKKAGIGTGQGLSIAHRLIFEKHSGNIEVDSTEGIGTTFRITLPISQLANNSTE